MVHEPGVVERARPPHDEVADRWAFLPRPHHLPEGERIKKSLLFLMKCMVIGPPTQDSSNNCVVQLLSADIIHLSSEVDDDELT